MCCYHRMPLKLYGGPYVPSDQGRRGSRMGRVHTKDHEAMRCHGGGLASMLGPLSEIRWRVRVLHQQWARMFMRAIVSPSMNPNISPNTSHSIKPSTSHSISPSKSLNICPLVHTSRSMNLNMCKLKVWGLARALVELEPKVEDSMSWTNLLTRFTWPK